MCLALNCPPSIPLLSTPAQTTQDPWPPFVSAAVLLPPPPARFSAGGPPRVASGSHVLALLAGEGGRGDHLSQWSGLCDCAAAPRGCPRKMKKRSTCAGKRRRSSVAAHTPSKRGGRSTVAYRLKSSECSAARDISLLLS
jgi:hypothetical protein